MEDPDGLVADIKEALEPEDDGPSRKEGQNGKDKGS